VKIILSKEKLQEKYEIIIIYHNCKPEMVVKEIQNYEATFSKQEKLVKQDVSKWKEALIKAVSLPGWDIKREERYPQVFRAIEQSRFLVVILSDGFASSPYCLRELVKIIEYKEKFQEKYEIIIVYHNCKPEMVVKEIENYEATFSKHEKLGKGSTNPTEPHHTPSPQEHHSPQHDSPPPSNQTIISEPIPQAPTKTLTPKRYTRRAIRIAHLDAGQDRENIAKTSAMPHESSSRVPSLGADEGSMQQRIHKLMELCTSLQRKQSHMAAKIKDQDLEISRLKARVKSLEDKERRHAEPTQEDAPITGGIIDIGEKLGAKKSTKLGSNDTKEMVNVLSSMEAINILSSGGAAASVSPADVLPTAGVSTVSGSFSTPMRIPIIREKDKVKEKMIETKVPKKRKLQEQIDDQIAREMEEEFARENQRLSEQLARDFKIARLHAEEELKIMIEGLDKSNEVIAKHLSEYEQAEADLSVREKIELIRELTKHFRGMTFEKIKEKFIPVWKQFKDFVPMSSKEESERVKRQGLKLDQGSSKRMKISEGASEEELKGMMQLLPLEEVYIEALQQLDREDLHQLWTLVKETFSTKHAIRDNEKELWVELKRLFKPDFEDQLWTHLQAFMHDPLDWKLYDTCGVYHVSTKDQEIFMLVEKDYLLRKGHATVMIIQDEELIEASSSGKGTRKPNLGGRRAGRLHTRQETRNLVLKAIMDKSGLVPIRELPLHYPSWHQMPSEQKAGVMEKIKTQFDLRPHMESERRPQIYASIQQHMQKIYNGKKADLKERYWVPEDDGTYDLERIRRGRPSHISETQFDLRPHMESDRRPQIYAGIQQHLQKIYNGKKAALKERYWVPEDDGTYDLERIRRGRPSHISEVDWDAQLAFWNDPKNLAWAARNKQNRAKSKVVCRQGSQFVSCCIIFFDDEDALSESYDVTAAFLGSALLPPESAIKVCIYFL
nr:NB-ARC domains-containing protein [Tanacetum cinerariifolium]